ncbi:MAG: mandelate racemase/muconate lactonizing enzyme family protein [Thermomicrobiales bacterium]
MLKITGVRTFLVDGGFRPWTFVKIETSDGTVGWGDCTDWGSPKPVAAMVERMAEEIIGRDPMQAEPIWWHLDALSVRHTGGIASKAMAGIDSALWDIRGKVLNAPVSQLLGGAMRDELRLYWSHFGSTRATRGERLGLKKVETTDDLRAICDEARARGYTAVKTNLFALNDRPDARPVDIHDPAGSLPTPTLRNAEAIIGTLRDALGPDVDIALDVAFRFKLGGAIKLAQALEPYNLMWLEVETFDPAALRLIRESTKTTICTGESLFGTQGFRPYLERHAQDIIMPDLAWNGITMGKKIADMAHTYDTLCAFHNCHSPLTTLVSAHVAATIPNFFILEIDEDDPPWRDDLMTHPFTITQGHLQVPQRPGLGSDLIEEQLLKHPPVDYPGAR